MWPCVIKALPYLLDLVADLVLPIRPQHSSGYRISLSLAWSENLSTTPTQNVTPISCNSYPQPLQIRHARMLLAADVQRNFRSPLPLDLMASCPQLPPGKPISPSIRPTSRPQAYPALKLMAEKTSTTPAEIIHDANVGLINSSLSAAADLLVARNFFVWRSLLDSRDFRFVCLGEELRLGRVALCNSDSGTRRSVVGCVDVRGGEGRVSVVLGRTAAAQDSSVVNEALNAASWSGW
jgi:hypothetical protein